jgi:hypothetical protein
MIMDILLFALSAVAGFAVGWYSNQRIMLGALTDMIQENIVVLTHEVEAGQHFLYYKEDGSFASQGNTLEEVAINFNRDNKGMIGRVIPSTGAEFFIVDGIIESGVE